MATLEIKNLSKAYKSNQVLKDTNITVNDGEMVALLGPSGSGKTTILRIVAGFIEANGGNVCIDGESILDLEAHKRNIGVVFQNYALFPHMTVWQNVEFGLKMRKLPAEERKARVEEALNVVDMLPYAKRYPNQLSGGQQQRVAIARVVAIRAKLMLLDEPLSNLDAKLRRQVRVEIKELQRKLKITTVIVTHDQEEAMTLGDRIAILNEGRIQQIGTPMDLYERPANQFVAGFLGTPSINFFEMEIRDEKCSIAGFDVFSDVLTERMKSLKNGKYFVGVRPEQMNIHQGDKKFIMPVKVSLIENLGVETLIYFMLNKKQYCSRVSRTVRYDVGTEIALAVDLENCVFFDAQTGENVDIQG